MGHSCARPPWNSSFLVWFHKAEVVPPRPLAFREGNLCSSSPSLLYLFHCAREHDGNFHCNILPSFMHRAMLTYIRLAPGVSIYHGIADSHLHRPNPVRLAQYPLPRGITIEAEAVRPTPICLIVLRWPPVV